MIACFAVAFPGIVAAHPGAPGAAGLLHPLTGWDHLLAALAVGIWAGQMRPRAARNVSLGFVVALLGGAALGMAIAMPSLPGLLPLLVVLALLATLAARPPAAWALLAIAVFGAYHGLVHGAAMPSGTSAVANVVGLALTSLALLVLGGVVGLALARGARIPGWLPGSAGAALALGSVALAVA